MSTEPNKEHIAGLLNTYCQQSESQAHAARKIGVSTATVSNILAHKWDKISGAMWRRVAVGVTPVGERVYPTSAYNTIWAVAEAAQRQGRMKAVVGLSGVGKTTALKAYSQNNRSVLYILAMECMTPRDLLVRLLKAAGINYTGSRMEMLDRLCAWLLEYDAPLIIIDDAGKLKEGRMHLFQQIYDLMEGHCGILLSGLPYMYDNLRKAAERERPGMPELKRRIGYCQPLDKPTPAEVAEVAKLNGIDAHHLWGKEMAAMLYRHCKDFGTLVESVQNILDAPESFTLKHIESIL